MSKALSGICGYASNCISHINTIENAYNRRTGGERNIQVDGECPEYPQAEFDRIQTVIENCDDKDAKILAEFLALSQVQNVRLKNFLLEINGQGPRRVRRPPTQTTFFQLYFDAVGLYKWAERPFEYARLESVEISELCNAGEAIQRLNVGFGIQNEGLAEFINKNWPPRINLRNR